MVTCPACMTENLDTSKFCSACGSALAPQCAATAPQHNGHAPRADASSTTGDSSHHGRFLPGTEGAEWYRIVSLVGPGGMGEVYRADDLKLGQTVALKFLPRNWDRDERRLEHFRNEVRLARSVAHPNVCRVYDIGDVDGQVLLSMESVDGEDLRSPLRRIRRLPKDKGIQNGEVKAQERRPWSRLRYLFYGWTVSHGLSPIAKPLCTKARRKTRVSRIREFKRDGTHSAY